MFSDELLQIQDVQTVVENDTAEQLQNKLKQYTTEMELLRDRGVGKRSKDDQSFFHPLVRFLVQGQVN